MADQAPPNHRAIAAHVLSVFGRPFEVAGFYHDTLPLTVDILSVKDSPWVGAVSVATIGLYTFQLAQRTSGILIRLELVGAGRPDSLFSNIICSAAFCIARSGQLFFPGDVVPNVVAEYYPTSSVPHLMLAPPGLWGERFPSLHLPSIIVAFLLAVPISESERLYLLEAGHEALEAELASQRIDYLDLWRNSVV